MIHTKVNNVRTLRTFAVFNSKSKLEFGLNKFETKQIKERLNQGKSSLNPVHAYKEAFATSNRYDLAKHLLANELFNEGGLIAINKPYGIPRYKSRNEDGTLTLPQALNASGPSSKVSLEEALPLIKKEYQSDYLEVIISPERWSSGILLLSTNEKLSSSVRKCIRTNVSHQKPFLTHWAVTVGLTIPEAAAERVGVGYQHVPNIGKVPVIKKKFSKNSVSVGDVISNVVEHKVLGHHAENDVSLVEVTSLNVKRHFLRVWLSHCCSPVLGDLIYGCRVKSILGKKVEVNLNTIGSYTPPTFSKKFMDRLQINVVQRELIPLHVHLAKIELVSTKRKLDLEITAMPPPHFTWTCCQLGLMSTEAENTPTPSSSSFVDHEEVIFV